MIEQDGVVHPVVSMLSCKQRRVEQGERRRFRIVRWPLVLPVFVLLASGACTAPSETSTGVVFNWMVSPEPPRVGPATITLTPTDTSGVPVEGADLTLEGTMTHPGMPPVFAEAREESPGIYRASFEFTMAGDWVIIIIATLPDGRTVRDQIEVYDVRAE